MRILVTGGRGMLGRQLAETLAEYDLRLVDTRDFDIADADAVDRAVGDFRSAVIVHCAAMTDVDGAERDPDAAFRVNAAGTANIAAACHRHGARLFAISTDYVFSGRLGRPYRESDIPDATNVYGRSKAAGEEAVRRHCPNHVICRIAWLYGRGGPSFVHAMLRAGREAGPPLRVVDDQIGNPTSTLAVARHLRLLLETPCTGTVHMTCGGEASRHEFAREIFSLWGLKRGLLPCSTAEFPRPAPRPPDSRLENGALRRLGLPPMPDWREALREFRRQCPDG